MSSVFFVCLQFECTVTKRFKLGSRSFYGRHSSIFPSPQHRQFYIAYFSFYLSDASTRRTANEFELKTSEIGPNPESHQQPDTSINNELVLHREQNRTSSNSSHYQEIVEYENSCVPPASDGVEEAEIQYQDLDPVAVAQRRAMPPPVYDDLTLSQF